MGCLNEDVPEFDCWLKKEYLYDQRQGHGEFERVVVFGVSSVPSRALGFHCLTDQGAVIWRLPISAFIHRIDAPKMELETLELWDAFSPNLSVHEFSFLKDLPIRTVLRDRKIYPGRYLFTIDWWGSSGADNAGDIGHKCAHILALNNGCYAAQPNNRIFWHEQAFVTKPFKERPDYLTNTHVWKSEDGFKWRTEDSEKMFYEGA